MSCCNVISALINSGMCALWTIIFYYCLNIWPESCSGHAQVITFMLYASAFLMVTQYLHLIQQLLNFCGEASCLGLKCCNATILCMAGSSTFCFLIVWSVMGANWLQDHGLGSDLWFKSAAITVCVISFLVSWGVLVLIVLGLVLFCCIFAWIINAFDQLDKEVTNLESEIRSSDQQEKVQKTEEKFTKITDNLKATLGKLPMVGETIKTAIDKKAAEIKAKGGKIKKNKNDEEEEKTKLVDNTNEKTVEDLENENKKQN